MLLNSVQIMRRMIYMFFRIFNFCIMFLYEIFMKASCTFVDVRFLGLGVGLRLGADVMWK